MDLLLVIILNDVQLPPKVNLVRFVSLSVCLLKLNFDKTRLLLLVLSISVYVICRQGNDSQLATVKLKEKLTEHSVDVKDIKGGLKAWSKHVDTSFPDY